MRTVCVTSLDSALQRYEWPSPNHLRVAETAPAFAVLAGARDLLASASLRTIFLTLGADDCGRVTKLVASLGWQSAATTLISRGRAHVLLSRNAPATA